MRSSNPASRADQQRRRSFVGVDSGGTTTRVLVGGGTDDGASVELAGRSLSSNRSTSELAAAIDDVFSTIEKLASPDASVWISAAGYARSTRSVFESLVRKRRGSAMVVGIANDGVTTLLAHEPGTIVVIAGTGSVVMARDREGDVLRRGGDEWVVADYGSAFWLGLAGVRAAYRAIEEGFRGALPTMFIEQFEAVIAPGEARGDLDDAAMAHRIGRALAADGATDVKPTIARFASAVTSAAELGDEVACTIIDASATELALAAGSVLKDLERRWRGAVGVRLCGGVANGSPRFVHSFSSMLETLHSRRIDVRVQAHGLEEATNLAQRLSVGETPSALDAEHPYSVIA